MGIALRTWQVWVAAIIIVLSIWFGFMDLKADPDKILDIVINYLKIVLGLVATVAAGIWAIFSWSNRKMMEENRRILNDIKDSINDIKTNQHSLNNDLKENSKKDSEDREKIYRALEKLASLENRIKGNEDSVKVIKYTQKEHSEKIKDFGKRIETLERMKLK